MNPRSSLQQKLHTSLATLWLMCLSIWGQTGAGKKDDAALQRPPTKLLLSL